MKSRFEVVELVRAKLRLKHFSLSTEDTYCGWVGHYGIPAKASVL